MTTPIDPTQLDLAEVTRALDADYPRDAVEGYVRGKTLLRDAAMARYGCSALMAEELIDTLEQRGFIRFVGEREGLTGNTGHWIFRDPTA